MDPERRLGRDTIFGPVHNWRKPQTSQKSSAPLEKHGETITFACNLTCNLISVVSLGRQVANWPYLTHVNLWRSRQWFGFHHIPILTWSPSTSGCFGCCNTGLQSWLLWDSKGCDSFMHPKVGDYLHQVPSSVSSILNHGWSVGSYGPLSIGYWPWLIHHGFWTMELSTTGYPPLVMFP